VFYGSTAVALRFGTWPSLPDLEAAARIVRVRPLAIAQSGDAWPEGVGESDEQAVFRGDDVARTQVEMIVEADFGDRQPVLPVRRTPEVAADFVLDDVLDADLLYDRANLLRVGLRLQETHPDRRIHSAEVEPVVVHTHRPEIAVEHVAESC